MSVQTNTVEPGAAAAAAETRTERNEEPDASLYRPVRRHNTGVFLLAVVGIVVLLAWMIVQTYHELLSPLAK